MVKILIVDDHEATVTFMRIAFSGAGHTVTTASNTGAALRQAIEDPPDVVLTDLSFGETGGGLELARMLRTTASTSWVGLLAVSGADAPEVLQATVESGFDGFVSKPVDLVSLLDRVDRLAGVVAERRTSKHQIDSS